MFWQHPPSPPIRQTLWPDGREEDQPAEEADVMGLQTVTKYVVVSSWSCL